MSSQTLKIVYPPESSHIPSHFSSSSQTSITKAFLDEAAGEDDSSSNYIIKQYTLVILHISSKSSLLLGLKNRGFGCGFYNSFGGKLDPSELSDPISGVVNCACREVRGRRSESDGCLSPTSLDERRRVQ